MAFFRTSCDLLACRRPTRGNTGDRDGSEVIQAYLSTDVDGPRLAAFARVSAPQGTRGVHGELTLPARAFQAWVDGTWQQRPGPFALHVGPSVANTPLTAELRLL